MKFYYIDDRTDIIIKNFIPRIPDAISRLKDENSTIPRVCVCRTLDGCLSAAPWQCDIEQYAEDEIPIRVYEFEYEKEKIIFNDKLYKDGLVDDANITTECWILENIKPTKIYDIIMDEVWYEDIAFIPYKHKDNEEYIDYVIGREYTLSSYRVRQLPTTKVAGLLGN